MMIKEIQLQNWEAIQRNGKQCFAIGKQHFLTPPMSKTDPSGFRGTFFQVSLTESTQSLAVWSDRLKQKTLCKSDCCEASVKKKLEFQNCKNIYFFPKISLYTAWDVLCDNTRSKNGSEWANWGFQRQRPEMCSVKDLQVSRFSTIWGIHIWKYWRKHSLER